MIFVYVHTTLLCKTFDESFQRNIIIMEVGKLRSVPLENFHSKNRK